MTKNMKILTAILVVAVILFVLKRKGMLGTTSTTNTTPSPAPVDPALVQGTEVKAGAQGACGHPNAPSSYQSGSYGCNFLMNCGAGGEATPNGTGGYTLSCNGQSMGETGSNGNSTTRPVAKSRSLAKFFGGTRRV